MASESSSSDRMYTCQWKGFATCAGQPLKTLRQYPMQGLVRARSWQCGQYCILSRALPHPFGEVQMVCGIDDFNAQVQRLQKRKAIKQQRRLHLSQHSFGNITKWANVPAAIRMHSEYSRELSVTPGLMR